MASKFYAIFEGRNLVKPVILRTWNECLPYVHGYKAKFKSFPSEQEAKQWIANGAPSLPKSTPKEVPIPTTSTSITTAKVNEEKDDKRAIALFRIRKAREDLKTVIVFTDGSCEPNPGPAAYAWRVEWPQESAVSSGCGFLSDKSTNNEAEYTAILEALVFVKKHIASMCKDHKEGTDFKVQVFSDSKLAVCVLRGEWKGNVYPELRKEIQNLMYGFPNPVFLNHIPAHRGLPGNEFVDELSKTARIQRTPPMSVLHTLENNIKPKESSFQVFLKEKRKRQEEHEKEKENEKQKRLKQSLENIAKNGRTLLLVDEKMV